jgi:hypothetical protein
MADSEGEENTMRTNQPDMVRQSLEATAHPDVYARRKVAEKVAAVVVEGAADVAIVAADVALGSVPLRPEGRERMRAVLSDIADDAAQVVIESDLRAPAQDASSVAAEREALDDLAAEVGRVAERLVAPGAEGDHDDPDHCTCPTTPRDADGNCDLIERDDCPVHGKAHESVLRRPDPRSSARARPGAVAEALGDEEPLFPLPQMDFSQRPQGLPDSADTRLHGSATTREDEDAAQYFGPSMADLGRRREGWRGRLAHVEMLLSAGRLRVGNVIPAEIDQALAELRALIDEA